MKLKIFLLVPVLFVLVGGTLILLDINKAITIVVDEERRTVNTWALRVIDVLHIENIPLQQDDLLDPPADTWIQEGDTIVLRHASRVEVVADGILTILSTFEDIPANILASAGVTLFPGDQILLDRTPISPAKALPIDQNYQLIVNRATPITLITPEKTFRFSSVSNTLGQALQEIDLVITDGDHIDPPLDTPLETIPVQATLKRAQNIIIFDQGETLETVSWASTVGEALTQAGLSLQGLDYGLPPEYEPIPKNGEINAVRVREEITIEQEPIPFTAQYQPLTDLDIDNLKIIQAGEYGLKASRTRTIYQSHPGINAGEWQEISNEIEDEWVAQEPKPRIVGYGTRINVRSIDTPDGPIQYWRAVEAYASSYSPCRSGDPNKCYPNTSSGKPVEKGVIAVILSWYRYMKGLAVYIPGYGFATIEDVGGGLPGQHWIDLGYSDEDWVGWGQVVTIYFLAPAPPPENILWILD
jgi:uncharacterized protein YabE (DUF348 family)